MTQPSFLWHDYETFGTDPRMDRPSQFAAIRTDLDLNVIGEPESLFCQPPPDYLPDPEACVLTGISPRRAQMEGVGEYAFALQIQIVDCEFRH